MKEMYRKLISIGILENGMTTLKNSKKRLLTHYRPKQQDLLSTVNCSTPSDDERFKTHLKRAVDSVEAPQYLIEAIRSAIRS